MQWISKYLVLPGVLGLAVLAGQPQAVSASPSSKGADHGLVALVGFPVKGPFRTRWQAEMEAMKLRYLGYQTRVGYWKGAWWVRYWK
jgi:hypothetical protein